MVIRFGTFLYFLFSCVAPLALASTRPTPNCGCLSAAPASSCGTQPAFFARDAVKIERELGFSIPKDYLGWSKTDDRATLMKRFSSFLENSAYARAINPEYYTRAAKDSSALTLNAPFRPKNPDETDEYLRCTLPADRYCLYRRTLRPYLGLAAKVSGIPYSFLACQAYVESRFDRDARSSVGAIGFAQIKESNVQYLNEVLQHAIHRSSNRVIATQDKNDLKANRILKAQSDIAMIWSRFWEGTPNTPKLLAKCDLTCYRQVFLAQALSLKTDMLALVTSSKGLEANYDETLNFRIESMDPGDSLLLLAGSYNIGVSSMIRLLSKYCHNSSKLKDCLDKMKLGAQSETIPDQARLRDIASLRTYIMRIRDCSQQYSAEQIDFEDDARWTDNTRSEKYNQQRDHVVQCLSKPCPYQSHP